MKQRNQKNGWNCQMDGNSCAILSLGVFGGEKTWVIVIFKW